MENMNFRLEAFEGPLDLLLHLVHKNKVNIYDIPIALILEQYMEYMQQIDDIDLSSAGDFLEMAANLMYIKSKMLLPRQEEEEDPRMDLAAMLAEYEKIKEQSLVIGRMYQENLGSFAKPQDIIPKDNTYRLSHRTEELYFALKDMMRRRNFNLPPSITRFKTIVMPEPYPVETKISVLKKRLSQKRKVSLSWIIETAHSKSEVIAGFLAFLELIRESSVMLEEDRENKDFIITLSELLDPETSDPEAGDTAEQKA